MISYQHKGQKCRKVNIVNDKFVQQLKKMNKADLNENIYILREYRDVSLMIWFFIIIFITDGPTLIL